MPAPATAILARQETLTGKLTCHYAALLRSPSAFNWARRPNCSALLHDVAAETSKRKPGSSISVVSVTVAARQRLGQADIQ